jgi:hypothetical protein
MPGLPRRTFTPGKRSLPCIFVVVIAIRRYILLILCLRLLLPAGVLTEALKLPALIGHFLHHNEEEGHVHWLGFLAEHYGSHRHHAADRADHHDHHNLPFGDHSDTVKDPVQPFLPVSGLKTEPLAPSVSFTQPLLLGANSCASPFAPSIWQPPKLG